jgi:ferredoxin-NADP reductase
MSCNTSRSDAAFGIHWMIGPSAVPANQFSAANLRRLVPDVAHRDVYLSASPGMSGAVRKTLHAAGLPDRRLHEKAFKFGGRHGREDQRRR